MLTLVSNGGSTIVFNTDKFSPLLNCPVSVMLQSKYMVLRLEFGSYSGIMPKAFPNSSRCKLLSIWAFRLRHQRQSMCDASHITSLCASLSCLVQVDFWLWYSLFVSWLSWVFGIHVVFIRPICPIICKEMWCPNICALLSLPTSLSYFM